MIALSTFWGSVENYLRNAYARGCVVVRPAWLENVADFRGSVRLVDSPQ